MLGKKFYLHLELAPELETETKVERFGLSLTVFGRERLIQKVK